MRLPTEAEWEKAARGIDRRIYPWGDTFDKNLLNSKESGLGDTTAVDSYPNGKSPYGAIDMAGNVWEWVVDSYDANYYKYSPSDNPVNLSTTWYRVVRGGSWECEAIRARVANRSFVDEPDYPRNDVGFRCAQ